MGTNKIERWKEVTLGSCSPDPHCSREGEKCKCCFNGRCDYEEMCKCGGVVMPLLNSHSEGSDTGAHDEPAELNSTGIIEALTSWWCEPVGGVCGGPWKLAKKCCGNAKCQKMLGGDGTMKCSRSTQSSSVCLPTEGAEVRAAGQR